MKPESKIIQGVTSRGTKGIRYEHNIPVGAKVKVAGRRGVGTVIGRGIAGMPEVKLGKGSCYYAPHELEMIDEDND